MDWTAIIVAVVSSGVITSVLTVVLNYIKDRKTQKFQEHEQEAKADSVDITNLVALINEERQERLVLRKEYDEYKQSVDKRIVMFKGEFDKLREENETWKKENGRQLAAIYQAWRCRLPAKLDECPVIMAFKEGCKDCGLSDFEEKEANI